LKNAFLRQGRSKIVAPIGQRCAVVMCVTRAIDAASRANICGIEEENVSIQKGNMAEHPLKRERVEKSHNQKVTANTMASTTMD
jgi:hypothetical protein